MPYYNRGFCYNGYFDNSPTYEIFFSKKVFYNTIDEVDTGKNSKKLVIEEKKDSRNTISNVIYLSNYRS